MPKSGERTGSYQCVYCHGLWDGPETWLDPFELERLCCGEPECRAAVEQVSALPLSAYLVDPEKRGKRKAGGGYSSNERR